MAKAYVTRTEDINSIWVFDVKSVDTERVVFSDGSTRLCHREYGEEQIWRTEEEARGAIAFAKRFAKNRLDWMKDQIHILSFPIDEDHIDIEQKN